MIAPLVAGYTAAAEVSFVLCPCQEDDAATFLMRVAGIATIQRVVRHLEKITAGAGIPSRSP